MRVHVHGPCSALMFMQSSQLHAVNKSWLQELTGKPHSDVLQLLHCRALGSYVRGKPDCGDVDFIISPGPAASGVGLGPLMAGLLSRLAEQGYVTQVSTAKTVSLTYMVQ